MNPLSGVDDSQNPVESSFVLGRQRSEFLDQIRTLAIIPVIIEHFHSDWVPGGGIGVGIFFALSGFLITTILLEAEGWGPAAAWKFIFRRFMRIYPAYVVAIIATVVFAYFARPAMFEKVMAPVFGLLTFSNFSQMSTWTGYGFAVLWTLQVEMAFYVLMPVSMLVMGRHIGGLIFSSLLILLGAKFLLDIRGSYLFVRFGAALGFGALLSFAWKAGWVAGARRYAGYIAYASVIGILILLFLPPATWRIWVSEVFCGALCGCGLIYAFLLNPKLPVFGPVAWIGRISYSLYLLHAVLLDNRWTISIETALLKKAFPFLPLSMVDLVAFILSSIILAALSFHFIERPGIRLGAAWIRLSFNYGARIIERIEVNNNLRRRRRLPDFSDCH